MRLPNIAPERLDPFGGFFRNHGPPPVLPHGLLDLPAVRRWFALLSWGDEGGLYTYQMPLDGRTGTRVSVLGRSRLMLSCCDYLGLAGHPAVEDAAIAAVRTYGTGTGGVRMLTGTTALHRDLECEIADFMEVEAALTFGSGYLANLAVRPRSSVRGTVCCSMPAHTGACTTRASWRAFR